MKIHLCWLSTHKYTTDPCLPHVIYLQIQSGLSENWIEFCAASGLVSETPSLAHQFWNTLNYVTLTDKLIAANMWHLPRTCHLDGPVASFLDMLCCLHHYMPPHVTWGYNFKLVLEVQSGKTLTKHYADIIRQGSILLVLVSITPFLIAILLRNFRLPFWALIVSTAGNIIRGWSAPRTSTFNMCTRDS